MRVMGVCSLSRLDFPTVTLTAGPMSTLSHGTERDALCCAAAVLGGAGFLSAAPAAVGPSTMHAASAVDKIARADRDSAVWFFMPSPWLDVVWLAG
jgi:hypothetical protein